MQEIREKAQKAVVAVPQSAAVVTEKPEDNPIKPILNDDAAIVSQTQTQPQRPEDAIKAELAALSTSDEVSIAPKKANWDLKNQMEAKIDKLKRRTQKAIVEMLREKLAGQEVD